MEQQVDPKELAAAVARHLATYQLKPAAWRPQPHQVPPPGDWYGWLLSAGRGAGKSATCARYVSKHVEGPPCLPGAVPHWISIIAPTLGDGVTSCYSGPAGLGSFDPKARLVQTVGGTLVRWENGSQAKVYGAHSQEDVERLRAGGNSCFDYLTPVLTARGEVPIFKVQTTDRVWTRNGLRRVLAVHGNGVHPLYRVVLDDGRNVDATADHRFYVDGRWTRVDQLVPNDRLTLATVPDLEGDVAPVDTSTVADGPHTRDGCSTCGAFGSPVADGPLPDLGTARVVEVVDLLRDEWVFDLTVEHEHEFFANGVLVANCLVWAEELAAWRYLEAAWQQMRFGLRSGTRPHWIASTTPKPRELIKKLVKQTPHNVVVTHATTHDNPHLERHVREALFDEYEGTDIGRQELYAEVMEQAEGALWQRTHLERDRLLEVPDLRRITVGVDPSGGLGEQGIVVAGKGSIDTIENGRVVQVAHGYVLADRTCRLSPDGWGRRAVQAAIDFEADDIVVEQNYGGDMALATITGAAEAMGISIPVRKTVASRGKRVRAEPVAALSERERWHHVGTFEQLEDQLCTWTPELGYSPDRLDAMVWTGWHNKLVSKTLHAVGSFGGRAALQVITG